MKPNITIIGDGTFGFFLAKVLAPHATITPNAEIVFLAVPARAYDEVAAEHQGKHLINICSVQRDTNITCLKHSNRVTSIHPLFGPQSPETGRSAILTYQCSETEAITNLFQAIGCAIVNHLPDGQKINGELHDRMMASSHLALLEAEKMLRPIVEKADWIPDNCLPTSFQRVRQFVRQCRDFSPGTLASIQSNPYSSPNPTS